MAFRGWAAEAIEFYEGLEADNSKAYWQAHKATYETEVRAPMEALLAELAPEFGDGKLFRPYRDVRFSADKSPYKTHTGALLEKGYVQFSADGLAAGYGMWEMAPDQLERYRAAVDDDGAGEDLAATLADTREGRPRDHEPRAAEDGAARLPEGPPEDRTAPVQGDRRVARVGRGRMARHGEGQGPRRVVPP